MRQLMVALALTSALQCSSDTFALFSEAVAPTTRGHMLALGIPLGGKAVRMRLLTTAVVSTHGNVHRVSVLMIQFERGRTHSISADLRRVCCQL